MLGSPGDFGNLTSLLGPNDALSPQHNITQEFNQLMGNPNYVGSEFDALSSQQPGINLQTAGVPSDVVSGPGGGASQLGSIQNVGMPAEGGFMNEPGNLVTDISTTPSQYNIAQTFANPTAPYGTGGVAPQVAGLQPPVSAPNALSGVNIGGAAPPPPGLAVPGEPLPPATYPTTAAIEAAPGAAATTAAATPAAASPSFLQTATQYAPLGALGLSGAGLGLNIANALNQPTIPPVTTAPLAPQTPAMDTNQMRQLLLNEGMTPQQADAYIAQINSRVASNPDALSSGLVTAG